jgi:hypothetical protein
VKWKGFCDSQTRVDASSLSSLQIRPQDHEAIIDQPDEPSIEFARGGRYVKVSIPGISKPSGGARGKIGDFSHSSRLAFLRSVNQIDRSMVDANRVGLVTLTYPGVGYPTPRASKRDLKVFLQRLVRDCPDVAGYWKLEPQRRGAPHYHLLLFAPIAMDWKAFQLWVAETWHEIAGNGDPKHLAFHMGTLGNGNRPCVERIRTWQGVASYAAKYIGKHVSANNDEGWEHPGRWWGKHQVKLLPIFIQKTVVRPRVAALLRRSLVRFYEHHLSGRLRCEPLDGGRVTRLYGKAEQLRDTQFGSFYTFRPYHRRWSHSRGGISVFMAAADVERLIAWAEKEADEQESADRAKAPKSPGGVVPSCFSH